MLAAAARPPLDLGVLAFVALVPLLVSWRGASVGAAAWRGFLAGAVYHGLLLSWVWYFGAIAIVPFVAILAAVWAAVGAAAALLARSGVRGPWAVGALWVLGEAVISRVPLGGFSWGELGYALHDLAPARWTAALGGLPLVTLCVVAINATLADVLVARREQPRSVLALRTMAATLTPLLIVVLLAPLAASTTTPGRTLVVAAIQGNDKNRDLTATERAARYLPASHFALADTIDERVDLIVFPESAMDADPRSDPFVSGNLRRIAADHDAYVLANAIVDADPEGINGYNQNFLFDPNGVVVSEYAKRHLVPFGEFVPMRDRLAWIDALDQIPRDWLPGTQTPLMDVDGVPLAQEICFEIAFGYQVRRDVAAGAHGIVVSTNNRSYRRSANAAQHLAISQMRAAETGRPVVHAAISGITGIVDANGDVQTATALFENGVTIEKITTRTGLTPYVRFGEWVLISCLGGLVAAVVLARRRARIEPSPEAFVDSSVDPAREVR